MPRGKFTNHKGRARRFTSPEELEEQSKQDQFKQRQRKKEESEGSDGSEEEGSGGSSDSESEEEHGKGKGVEKLIEVENPNRVQKKSKKLATLNTEQSLDSSKPELSRREREELEKQRAWAHYNKMHAEGKTEEARADLARLAIIKKQREEAAKKREIEKQAKEAAKQAKTAATNKALGKKT